MEAMVSSRRLKKGPGRRPLSAKRQKFMGMLERGWSTRGAAREVAVSRSSGTNWTSGMKVIRGGVQVGFVPPLDRLQVRQISSRYLSQDERIRIADLRKAGLGVRQIAARLGRAPSTISRELRRKVFDKNGYAPFDAHQHAVLKRARYHRRRVETNSDLRQVVVDLLAQRWSPQKNQSPSHRAIARSAVDASVSREYLPISLSVRVGVYAAVSAGAAASVAAAHGTGSPTSAPHGRAPPAAIPATDAEHSPASVRFRRPV
jgi:transposase